MTNAIAYIEAKAAKLRALAQTQRNSGDTDGSVQQAIALEAVASDLRAGIHEEGGVTV